jgi:CubicO group peptidase (beta-lactamase class C family)
MTRVKRFVTLVVLLLVAAICIGVFARDTVYWKRRGLQVLFSPATLPANYFEPSQVLEGSEGPATPRVDPEQERLDPASLAAAADYASRNKSTALIVGRHGHIVYEQYWDGADFDTVIDSGAMTATLTAMTVGLAMADRKIGSPAEPVANYIESFRDGNRATVTLENLLHMTSDLGTNQGGADPWTASTREQLVHDIRDHCLANEPFTAPGRVWHPQPCDPQLLAHIIERATGEPYAQYVSTHLWKPLGAGDAGFMLDHDGGTAHASCCLRARQGDWMRVGQLLVSDGKFEGEQLLPPGWVRTMLTPSKANPRFGYQLWRGEPFEAGLGVGASEPYAMDDTIVLRGNGKTRLWLVPSMGLIVLRVGHNAAIDNEWDDSTIPNIIIRGARDYVPKAARPDATDLRNLVPNH